MPSEKYMFKVRSLYADKKGSWTPAFEVKTRPFHAFEGEKKLLLLKR